LLKISHDTLDGADNVAARPAKLWPTLTDKDFNRCRSAEPEWLQSLVVDIPSAAL
jgi:hypothetical protein